MSRMRGQAPVVRDRARGCGGASRHRRRAARGWSPGSSDSGQARSSHSTSGGARHEVLAVVDDSSSRPREPRTSATAPGSPGPTARGYRAWRPSSPGIVAASASGASSTIQAPPGYSPSSSSPIRRRQPGLPDSSSPDQRQQAGLSEPAPDLGDLALAPDEAGELLREVVLHHHTSSSSRPCWAAQAAIWALVSSPSFSRMLRA